MFQTLGYFLELSLSIYFLSVVILFLINVCEFMPMTGHEPYEEQKILIRTPSTPKTAAGSKPVLNNVKNDTAQDTRSTAAWGQKSQPGKLPSPKSSDRVPSDPLTKDHTEQGQLEPPPGENESPEKSAQPDAKTEQSPEETAGNQESQETPVNDGPAAAPADDSTAPTPDDGAGTTPPDYGAGTTPLDDGAAVAPADDGEAPADSGRATEDADGT